MRSSEKTALVIVGGAFRSTYYTGNLMAIDELGIKDNFDVSVGISAGAPILAYFLTGQLTDMPTIWKDHIPTKNIYNPKNIFTKKPILNLDYLIDEVCSKQVPLNFDILKQKNLLVPIMRYDTGEIDYFDPKLDEFKEVLKASMSIPWLTRKFYVINNKKYVDAGIAENLILKKLIEDGYSKILLLISHTGIHDLPNWKETLIEKSFFLFNPVIGKIMKKLIIANIEEKLNLSNNKNCQIITISPKKYHVAKFENSKDKLSSNIEQGYKDIMDNSKLKEKLLKEFSK